jgi:hypothetical protein
VGRPQRIKDRARHLKGDGGLLFFAGLWERCPQEDGYA